MGEGISDVVIVAIIVAFTSVFSPLLLAFLTSRQKHADRQEDWARQDAVAAKAAEAAQLLVESNKKQADLQKVTIGKLDVIHTLVNSNMTSAMQAELDATIRELAMMQEVIDLKESAGKKPLPVAERAVALTEARIAELSHQLDDRKAAAAIVANQEEAAVQQGIGQGNKPL